MIVAMHQIAGVYLNGSPPTVNLTQRVVALGLLASLCGADDLMAGQVSDCLRSDLVQADNDHTGRREGGRPFEVDRLLSAKHIERVLGWNRRLGAVGVPARLAKPIAMNHLLVED
jgi:hypothetical protein